MRIIPSSEYTPDEKEIVELLWESDDSYEATIACVLQDSDGSRLIMWGPVSDPTLSTVEQIKGSETYREER